MYKLTVIVPVYNGEEDIKPCLNSLLNQTIGFDNLEIIFVDDCSTDNSWKKLNELSLKYSNVSCYKTDKTSGASGKPRNIGIEHSSTPFIMLLDVDDIYFKDTCETLYNLINENNVDLVSGNYAINDGKSLTPNKWNGIDFNEGIVKINHIEELPKLLYLPPAVWTKIYRKQFLIDKNLVFEEGIPAEDLIFVSQALFEANGIIYIDKPVVNYTYIRNQEGTGSTSKDKKTLSIFIDAYTVFYNILKKKYPHRLNLGLMHLDFFMNRIIASDLPPEDIKDLFIKAEFLIKEFNNSPTNVTQKNYTLLYKLIEEKKYNDALYIINLLKSNQIDYLDEKLKSKEIILLFFGFDENIGGLAKAVFNKANLLAEKGHKVTLLNIDSYVNYGFYIPENNYKNLKNIENKFRKLGYISDRVNFINMFEYYNNKNTENPNSNINKSLNKMNTIEINDTYVIQNIKKEDGVRIVNFFYKTHFTTSEINVIKSIFKEPISKEIMGTGISKLFKKRIIRTENYINNTLNVVTIHGKKDIFYTSDGFVYLEILKEDPIKYILHDRKTNFRIKFNNLTELCDYFIKEICIKFSEKPLLINECSGDIPSFNNITSEFAYKIGCVHSNPYTEYPHCYGSPMRNISVLKNVNQLDALIALTESEKNDFIKEFSTENIYSVPNIIELEKINANDYIKKDFKKISIFSRISPEKNLSDLIEAFKIINEIHPDAKLNIYGRATSISEKKEYYKLSSLIHESNLEDTILLKGHVNNAFEEMGNSLATLLVSDIEGMPLVILESMANKTPVISYDINYGPKDIINNEIDGFIVKQYDINELANKIIFLLDNPDIAIEMGKSAQENIYNNFSSEAIYTQLINVMRNAYINSEIKIIQDNFDQTIESQKISNENKKLIEQNNKKELENKKLIEQNNKKEIENSRLIEEKNQINAENNYLINENNKNKNIINNLKTTNEYYKLKNKFKKKILFSLPYLYIIFIHKDIILNIKLYQKLKDNNWFDIGFYINNNPTISQKKWCKLLTPETHYVCHGFDEKRLPNSDYENNLTKKELIDKL